MSALTRALYRYTALPVVDLARRTDSLSEYHELDRTQWLPRERLEALQLARLQRLLIHASLKVPYYHELFRTAGFDPHQLRTSGDLQVLPFLTKDILRQNSSQLMAENSAEFQPRPHRSAGTTGQPVVIQMDRKRHSIAWADMYRWWSAGGWRLGDKQFVVAGAALRPRSLSGLKAKIYARLNRFEDFTAFDLSEPVMDRLLTTLEHQTVSPFVRGYASSIASLARHASLKDWNGSVRAVFTTAETLFPEQRKLIESALHGPVFDQWGCRDGGISAFECESHRGLHLAIENAYVEFLVDGRPARPGESGEVVATDLYSYAMPIIRYRVGDFATLSGETCPCGRGLPLIQSVQGRVSGFLIGGGGRRIHGEYFSHVFWETPWVKEFQIVQERLDEILVKIVVQATPPPSQVRQISGLMQNQVGSGVRVTLQFVDELPAGPMGKRQFVICKVQA